FTFTTAIFHLAKRYAAAAKEIMPDVTIIGGGPHAPVLPEEVLTRAAFDVFGRVEGDCALAEIVSGTALETILGVSYRIGDQIKHNPSRPNIPHLDALP